MRWFKFIYDFLFNPTLKMYDLAPNIKHNTKHLTELNVYAWDLLEQVELIQFLKLLTINSI